MADEPMLSAYRQIELIRPRAFVPTRPKTRSTSPCVQHAHVGNHIETPTLKLPSWVGHCGFEHRQFPLPRGRSSRLSRTQVVRPRG